MNAPPLLLSISQLLIRIPSWSCQGWGGGRMMDRTSTPKCIVRVHWEPVATSTSARASTAFQGRSEKFSPSGPCSAPPSMRLLQGAVAARLLVPVVAKNTEPVAKDQRELSGILSGLVSLWDSRGSWQVKAGQAQCCSGSGWSINTGVGRDHGTGILVSLKVVLPNCQTTYEGEEVFHTHCLQLRWNAADLDWGYSKAVEHFEDLLSPILKPSIMEAKQSMRRKGDYSPITGCKVTNVVKQLHSGRAPRMDQICLEFLKVLNLVGLSWLTCLCKVALRSGALADWGGGVVVVSLFKKI